jgi:hypothetical protein
MDSWKRRSRTSWSPNYCCVLSQYIFQLLEILLYCSYDWARVSLVCKYITKSSGQNNTLFIDALLLLMGKFSLFMETCKWFSRWENKIGQYSFMDSFNYPGHRFLEKRSLIFAVFRRTSPLAGKPPGFNLWPHPFTNILTVIQSDGCVLTVLVLSSSVDFYSN